MLVTIKTIRDEPLSHLALTTSFPTSIALGLHKHPPGFPFLGLKQYEVAIISNVSFNVVEETLLYNKLEAQYVKIRIHGTDVNLRSKQNKNI